MIEIQTASAMEDLAGALAGRLRSDPLGPFEEEVILVGDARGLTDRLRLHLTRRLGIAASLHFPTPAQLVEDFARRLFPERQSFWLPEVQQEEEALVWQIYGALHHPSLSRFQAPSRHFRHASDVHRFRFARRMAALFRSYAQQRPDLLLEWENGERRASPGTHAEWQAALWTLIAETPAAKRLAGTHREVLEFLSGAPERSEEVRAALPRRVILFGVTRLPETTHQVLEAAARHVDILWYLLQHEEDRHAGAVADTMSALWGTIRRYTIGRVSECAATTVEVPPASHPESAPALLPRLQSALRGVPGLDAVAGSDSAGDHCLQVHVCHSPLRELEVVRDVLIEAFEEIPGLRPDDVLVAIPDVAEYGPLIEAVFGQTSEHDPRLPFHIVHRGSDVERRLADSFIRLLGLVRGRFEVDHVLDLLETPALRRAAGFDAAAVSVLRSLLAGVNVHWGKDAAHKATLGLPATEDHTWRAGLDRLLMGVMTGPVDAVVSGILPSEESEPGRAELLGAFATWFDGLVAAVAALDTARTPSEWAECLTGLAQVYYRPDDAEESRAFQRLLKGLEELRGDAPQLPFDVVEAHLSDSLPVAARSSRFVTGRITFAEFHVFQGASFRVAAALGLEDGRMPRKERSPGYDLIARDPRPGDAEPDAVDRQAFLDLILSTSDRLLLLYPGRSETDMSERAPSVLLSQLIETCRMHFGAAVAASIRTEHRLQPFSRAYFEEQNAGRLFTYSSALLGAAGASRAEPLGPFCPEPLAAEPPDGKREVSLRNLVEAWVNPPRFFCRQRLRLTFPEEESALNPLEPMELNALDEYLLANRVVEDVLVRGRAEAETWERVRRDGSLPPAHLGRAVFLQLGAKAGRFADELEGVGPLGTLPFELDLGTFVLSGELDGLTESEHLRFRPSKLKNKDLIRAWIRHLILLSLSASDERLPPTTRVVGTDQTVVLGPVDDPRTLLIELVGEMEQSLLAPQPFFERSSRAFAEAKPGSDVGKAVRSAFLGGEYARGADADDEYVALCFRDLVVEGLSPLEDPALSEAFARLATLFWLPLNNARV